MARITDKTKVQRLKQSTMKMVVAHGYGGASAALISKDANVASGYFYLHYKGKYEMVKSILHEVYVEVVHKFDDLIKQNLVFDEIIKGIVKHFVKLGNEEPIKLKFFIALTNDYSFDIDKEIKEDTFSFIHQISELGKETNTIDPKLTDDDLFLILTTIIFQYINQKMIKEKTVNGGKETDHLLYLINKLLK